MLADIVLGQHLLLLALRRPRLTLSIFLLSLGGSDYAMNELKIGGVDLTTPEPVKAALNVFAESVQELSALLDELNA